MLIVFVRFSCCVFLGDVLRIVEKLVFCKGGVFIFVIRLGVSMCFCVCFFLCVCLFLVFMVVERFGGCRILGLGFGGYW